MKLGFIVLVHENLERVAQLVSHLAGQDCPVSLHVDAHADASELIELQQRLQGYENVLFPDAIHCEWGRFTLVQATLNAAELLMQHHPDLDHIMLISGSCLPTRPISQLKGFLSKNRKSDFIESVSVENDKWVAAGLNEERFTLYFPVSWRTNRFVFDRLVELQRKLSISRKIPENIVPHTGSQWWCLTGSTLRKILDDPKRHANDVYFKDCWIPDESYFQSLARTHSERIEVRSLTFSKFDGEGRPFVMYDDHLERLKDTDAFFARKVWVGADLLYDRLLSEDRPEVPLSKAGTLRLNTYFDQATRMRANGGVGRYNPGRFPGGKAGLKPQTVRPYAVYIGLGDLFKDIPDWLAQNTSAVQHGNVFHRHKVEFEGDTEIRDGNLTANVKIRNRDPRGFLRNMLWNQKGKHHGFQFDLRDHQRVRAAILQDRHARILIIRESWILKYLAGIEKGKNVPSYARRLQNMERSLLHLATQKSTQAKVHLVDLQEVLEHPAKVLNMAVNLVPRTEVQAIHSLPKMIDLAHVNKVILELRNQGMAIQTDEVLFSSHDMSDADQPVMTPRLVK